MHCHFCSKSIQNVAAQVPLNFHVHKNIVHQWKVRIIYLHIIRSIENISLLPILYFMIPQITFDNLWDYYEHSTNFRCFRIPMQVRRKKCSKNLNMNHCNLTKKKLHKNVTQNGVKMSQCDFLRLCSFPWVMRQLLLENAVINFGLIARNSSHFHTPQ